MTYSGVPGDSKCECADSKCPSPHGGNDGGCIEIATCILYRIDMADVTGTAFCDDCAEDTMESGLFTDSTEDEDVMGDDAEWESESEQARRLS